jgi:small subunit ribosomal protein S9
MSDPISEIPVATPPAADTTPQFRWHAIGRRKTSVARVYLTPGTGKWDVNGRTLGDYFPRPSLVLHIQQSFTATDTLGAFDVKARVTGGGMTGQAGAIRMAIARALCLADEMHRTKLRANGLLTRDPRAVERKKPGRPGARKRFQFSKR